MKVRTSIYGIECEPEPTFKLRVLQLGTVLPEMPNRSAWFNQMASHLWQTAVHSPVVPFFEEKTQGFLVQEDADLSHLPKTLGGPGGLELGLEATHDTRIVTPASADAATTEIIEKLLNRAFSDRVSQVGGDRVWRLTTQEFYGFDAERGRPSDYVNAYRGFRFGATVMSGGKLGLGLDARTTYFSRRSLASYMDKGSISEIRGHLRTTRTRYRPSFLRDSGRLRRKCKFMKNTKERAGDSMIPELGITVREYYASKYGITIAADDPVVLVMDGGGVEGKLLRAPASRLYPIFQAGSREVRASAIKSQMPPATRFEEIARFAGLLDRATIGTMRFNVAERPLEFAATPAIPPKLVFGDGAILAPASLDAPKRFVAWNRGKMERLQTAGAFHKEPIGKYTLVYPKELALKDRARFVSLVETELSLLSPKVVIPRFGAALAYDANETFDSSVGAALRTAAKGGGRSMCLVLLADDLAEETYSRIKDPALGVGTQCCSMRTYDRVVREGASSVLRNLVLGILAAEGSQPWVLDESLAADVYLGIDTLQNRVAYHYFSGKGGRNMSLRIGVTTSSAAHAEGIKTPILQRRLLEDLPAVAKGLGRPIRSLVIHRDGRWTFTERKAFRNAITLLKGQGDVTADFRFAVLEIHKSHFPARIAWVDNDNQGETLRNPVPGTAIVLNDRRAMMVTTGKPYSWDGEEGRTAGTLLIAVAESSGLDDIQVLARDTFWMTQLNWSAPEIAIKVPVTIRWADEALRETRPEGDADEADEMDDD